MHTVNQVSGVEVECVGNPQPDGFMEGNQPEQFDQTVEVFNNRAQRGLVVVEARILAGLNALLDSRRGEIIDKNSSKRFTITIGVPAGFRFSPDGDYSLEVEATNFRIRTADDFGGGGDTTSDGSTDDSGGDTTSDGSTDDSGGGSTDDDDDDFGFADTSFTGL